MTPDLARQWQRLSALLSEERVGGAVLRSVEPAPSAAEVGAIAAVGYETRDPHVAAAVYLFAGGASLRTAAVRLKELRAGDPCVYVRTAANGPMLLCAHARIDGADAVAAEHRLDRILGAFCGDE